MNSNHNFSGLDKSFGSDSTKTYIMNDIAPGPMKYKRGDKVYHLPTGSKVVVSEFCPAWMDFFGETLKPAIIVYRDALGYACYDKVQNFASRTK